MKLIHRGLTIELPEDDRRVAVIETLLFGGPLPAPEPAPVVVGTAVTSEAQVIEETEAAPDVSPTRDPLSEVPVSWQRLWRLLNPMSRRWLTRLSEGPVLARQVPQVLAPGRGRSAVPLSGIHVRLRNTCRMCGVEWPILSRGRGRERRYVLTQEGEAMLKRLLAAEREAA